jgi:hypothetical protein
MFKEIKYDIELKKGRRKDKYAPEIEALHEFNGGGKTNMVFTYDNKRDAINAYTVIKRYLRNARMPLFVRQFDFVNIVIERASDV